MTESLPSDVQQPLHRHERAERVAVGVLVRGQHEALVLADPRRAPARACPSPISHARSRRADLVEDLPRRAAPGRSCRRRRTRAPACASGAARPRRAPCRKPWALAQALRASPRARSGRRARRARRARSRTRAHGADRGLSLRRSPLRIPPAGPSDPPATASPITWRIASSTRRMRPVLILLTYLCREEALTDFSHAARAARNPWCRTRRPCLGEPAA